MRAERNTSKDKISSERFLPDYGYHVSDNIITLSDDKVMFTVRFEGVPFEVINDTVLENNFDSLNSVLMTIAKSVGSRLAVWGHIDHFKTDFSENYQFESEWLQGFSQRYMKKIKEADAFENRFYLSFILTSNDIDTLEESITEMKEIAASVTQSLQGYEPEVLSSYTKNGHLFSEVYEFLGYLYNGFWEAIPVTSLACNETIQSSMLHFGYKLLETRLPNSGRRFSVYSDLKDFPDPTTRGMLNPLLEAPYPFILGISITLLNPAKSIKMISAQSNKLVSAGDEAVEQIDENEFAKGAITSGKVYFGELHAGLAVFGTTEREAEANSGTARTTLSSYCASLFVPANITAPETFFGMFPGNVKKRPRPMPKTTRNFFGMFSMNTYSSGKQHKNPIGDGTAILPLKTSAHGVYHFNFHYSLNNQDASGEKLPGHCLMLGATGVGKTTLQTALLAFTQRFNTKIFALDREGSMRGLIEALGGAYFTLENGVPTGLNPFHLPDTAENKEFLYDLVGACGRSENKPFTAEDKKEIREAVDSVLKLDRDERRFSVLMQSIPDHGSDCLKRRLSEWCYGFEGESDGRFAYALDNPENTFNPENFRHVGFDVKDFLVDGHAATEPLLSYLLHLKKLMQRGGDLMATVVEEFWLPISYPSTAAQIKDILKTGRRRGEFVLLVSQSPKDVIKSPLLSDILEQVPTKVYLANPDAVYHDEISGEGYENLGLSVKEFEKLPKDKFKRTFLVKQGSQSIIARLDLNGMGDDIAVMAMADEDFKYLNAAKASAGNNPNDWIPLYTTLRNEGRLSAQSNPKGVRK